MLLPIITSLCFGIAFFLLWIALQLRKKTGIPWKRIVESDMGMEYTPKQPIVSPHYQLAGRPDYILQSGRHWIPVEVKPSRKASQPYESDIMQLLAYCLLLECTHTHPPPYGLLRYAHASFRIPYTPTARKRLLAVLDEMKEMMEEDTCARNHNNPNRCRGCGFVTQCEDALV